MPDKLSGLKYAADRIGELKNDYTAYEIWI
jgi:hypothetical protein